MKNKIILITGGNTGIGLQTAIGLAKLGAQIIIACRNKKKGETAVTEIQSASNNENISFIHCDLSSFKSIQSTAKFFLAQHQQLDVLINNAGIVMGECKPTQEGYEMQFGVNHLGHFYLTQLLLETLQNTPKSRIVNVSSKAHYGGKIDFNSLTCPQNNYSPIIAYRQAKLANVLFTRELAKRYPNIISNCLHPGVVGTEIGTKEVSWWVKLIWKLGKPFMLKPEQGADTSIYLASSPDVAHISGQYFDAKKQYKPSPEGRDEKVAKKLWEWSLEQIKIQGK